MSTQIARNVSSLIYKDISPHIPCDKCFIPSTVSEQFISNIKMPLKTHRNNMEIHVTPKLVDYELSQLSVSV